MFVYISFIDVFKKNLIYLSIYLFAFLSVYFLVFSIGKAKRKNKIINTI